MLHITPGHSNTGVSGWYIRYSVSDNCHSEFVRTPLKSNGADVLTLLRTYLHLDSRAKVPAILVAIQQHIKAQNAPPVSPPVGRRALRRQTEQDKREQDKREYEDSDSDSDSNREYKDSHVETIHAEAFRILGLQIRATRTEVRAAFFALARLSHPDKGGDVEMFKRVKQAYEQLIC